MSVNCTTRLFKLSHSNIETPAFGDFSRPFDSIILPGGPFLRFSYMSPIFNFLIHNDLNPLLVGYPGHEAARSCSVGDFETIVQSVISVLSENKFLELKYLIGHSLGGWVMNRLLAQNCIDANSAKLTHVCTPSRFEPGKQLDEIINTIEEKANIEHFYSQLLPHFFADKKNIVQIDQNAMNSKYSHYISSEDIRSDHLSAISRAGETRYIFGEKDLVSEQPYINSAKQHSVCIENCGHFPMLEKTQEFLNTLKKFHPALFKS